MNSVLPTTEQERRRFWAKVDRRDGGCWAWTGYSLPYDGRGKFGLKGYAVFAPRVAWAIANGREPNGLVLHSCDNPNCVNPAHLRVGTFQENIRDRDERGRHWASGVTHCVRGHEFAGSNLYVRPDGRRKCRACAQFYRERKSRGAV